MWPRNLLWVLCSVCGRDEAMKVWNSRSQYSKVFRKLWFRYDGRCAYCHRLVYLPWDVDMLGLPVGVRATVDHIRPRSKGGARLDPGNLALACFACNRIKDDGEMPQVGWCQSCHVTAKTLKNGTVGRHGDRQRGWCPGSFRRPAEKETVLA